MEELRNSQTYIDMYAKYIKTGKDKEIRAFLKSHKKEFRVDPPGPGPGPFPPVPTSSGGVLTENALDGGQIPVPEFVYDTVKTAWEDSELLRYVRKLYVKGNLKVGFEIASTGASIHLEGDGEILEEELEIGVVELVPAMVKKYVMLSDELEALASRDFLMYVYDELTHQIALKLEEGIIDVIVNQPIGVTVPEVVNYGTNPKPETIAMSLSKLCAEAKNPVVIMNRGTWGEFKKAQYEANYPIDVFENLTVIFSDALPPFAQASVNGPYMIVGDFENGFLMNYPEGDEIRIKRDDITLATQDLVRYVGRVYCAIGVIAPRHFVAVTKTSDEGGSSGGGGITPQGKITITENGTDIDVSSYALADVDVSRTVNFDGQLTLVNNLDSGAVVYGYVGEDGTFKERYTLSLGASVTINVPTETDDDITLIKCLILLYASAQTTEYTITPSTNCFVKYTWDTSGYVPVYVMTYGSSTLTSATLTFTTKQ